MTRKKQKTTLGDGGAVAEKYEPTEREREAEAKVRKATNAAPGLKSEMKDGVVRLSIDYADQHYGMVALMDAVGVPDRKVFNGLLLQLGTAACERGEDDGKNINFMLGVMKGIAPRDTVEAMLASQMAAVHTATMTMAGRLAAVETIPQQDSAERALNKLTRTFTTQVEALKRYRTGGQQKVIVEHVTVNDGGQAIVGNVATGGRGNGKR